jgi:hypothetical protein
MLKIIIFKALPMQCNPLRIANWNDWSNFSPIDPLQLISRASLQMGVNPVDTGVYLDSTTFAAPTPSVIPTPEIIAISVRTNLGVSRELANMPTDIIPLQVNIGDAPNIIDVTFSAPVDPTSVTTITFSITLLGVPVAGTISFPTLSVARFTTIAPLSLLGTYVVVLKGSSTPYITFNLGATALDGEPTQLPSGDGTPGGNFIFSIILVAANAPPVYPPASIFGWNSTQFLLDGLPTCSALGSDNSLKVADANRWNFQHRTANLDAALTQPLKEVMFFRAGNEWIMNVPIGLGTLAYPDLQLSFRNDAGTRGDYQGAIPVISFTARNYTGSVNLALTLRTTGTFIMGLRAIDLRGNYYMYESTWRIVI